MLPTPLTDAFSLDPDQEAAGRAALRAALKDSLAQVEQRLAQAAAHKPHNAFDGPPARPLPDQPDRFGNPTPILTDEGVVATLRRQIAEIDKADAADPFNQIARVTDLLAEELAEPEFVVEGLVPTGLVILAGRPKSGKSWLAYAIALAVTGGHNALGSLTTKPRPVLYLALEDTKVRLKSRTKRLIDALGLSGVADGFSYLCNLPKSGEGGLKLVERWFARNPGGVVVVDTLQKFRDAPKNGSGSYGDDYEQAGRLKKAADKFGGLVILVHHTRKQSAADPFDEVSGTLGLTGAADATIVLERNGPAAFLYVRGRDLADATFSLAWDSTACLWSVTGRKDGVFREEAAADGLATYKQCANWLVEYLGHTRRPDSVITSAAQTMGYTLKQLRMAKDVLKAQPADQALQSRQVIFGGPWWSWIGDSAVVPPEAPGPTNAAPPDTETETASGPFNTDPPETTQEENTLVA